MRGVNATEARDELATIVDSLTIPRSDGGVSRGESAMGSRRPSPARAKPQQTSNIEYAELKRLAQLR